MDARATTIEAMQPSIELQAEANMPYPKPKKSRQPMISDMKAFHKSGQEAGREWGATVMLAKERRKPLSFVYKARLFARQYSTWGDVKRALIRRERPIPSLAQLQLLVRADKKRHAELIARVDAEGWSLHRLNSEVTRQWIADSLGRLRGRSPRMPRDMSELLYRLHDLAGNVPAPLA